mgnify:FL=1
MVSEGRRMTKIGLISSAALVALLGSSLYLSRFRPSVDEDLPKNPNYSSSEQTPGKNIPAVSPIVTRPYVDSEKRNLEERVPVDSRIPSLETFARDYVPASWTADPLSFYGTAVEQLIGGNGVKGVVSLFEELPRDKLVSVADGWKEWASSDGGVYAYRRADGRHHFKISGKEGFRLNYQAMSDGKDSLDLLVGERWGTKDEKHYAWEYMIHPVKYDGVVPLGAFVYNGKKFGGEPLFESYDSIDRGNFVTSPIALSILRDRKLDTLFKELKD